tara:strand:+ start:4391 stop:5287 length:897 start_codon:yes stop_codon:yes gene_type:complete
MDSENYKPNISIIIVTYNSNHVIHKCIDFLSKDLNNKIIEIVVIDNGSKDDRYLSEYDERPGISIHKLKRNIGFGAANNVGYNKISKNSKYVLFLNPDAFVTDNLLQNLYNFMENEDSKNIAICSPLLLRYSLEKNRPLEELDSAGIKKKWYGRYYDSYRGKKIEDLYNFSAEKNLLICGAFMFCRQKSLKETLRNGKVWDERIFIYKEDIDLSLYLMEKGWDLKILPDLYAYHCRGWNKKRLDVSSSGIKLSLKGDWIIHFKKFYKTRNQLIHLVYLIFKSFIVFTELTFRKVLLKK